jgi:hypothetical protein
MDDATQVSLENVRPDRLDEMDIESRRQRRLLVLASRVSAQGDELGIRSVLSETAGQIATVHHGQPDVDEGRLRAELGEGTDRLLPVMGHTGHEAAPAKLRKALDGEGRES